MSRLWREGGEVTAWTDREGPGRESVRGMSRGWSAGLGGGWVAAMIPIIGWGCQITCPDGACPELPGWVDATAIVFLFALLSAVTGLFLHRMWAPVVSAVAAGLGLALSTTDLRIPAWAVFELVTFGLLALASGALLVGWIRTGRPNVEREPVPVASEIAVDEPAHVLD